MHASASEGEVLAEEGEVAAERLRTRAEVVGDPRAYKPHCARALIGEEGEPAGLAAVDGKDTAVANLGRSNVL